MSIESLQIYGPKKLVVYELALMSQNFTYRSHPPE